MKNWIWSGSCLKEKNYPHNWFGIDWLLGIISIFVLNDFVIETLNDPLTEKVGFLRNFFRGPTLFGWQLALAHYVVFVVFIMAGLPILFMALRFRVPRYISTTTPTYGAVFRIWHSAKYLLLIPAIAFIALDVFNEKSKESEREAAEAAPVQVAPQQTPHSSPKKTLHVESNKPQSVPPPHHKN